MSNGLAVGCQLAYEAVGNAFVDQTGNFADFTNHGGGCTFADDGSWDTGRVVITPGDGVSWLELAKSPVLRIHTGPYTIAVCYSVISFTGEAYQDPLDWGDELYWEILSPGNVNPQDYFMSYRSDNMDNYSAQGQIPLSTHQIVLINLDNNLDPGVCGNAYLNNALLFSRTGAVTTVPPSDANPITLGDYYPGGDPGNFTISQLVKWDRVLSADEQTAFYNGGAGLKFASFDSGGGATPQRIGTAQYAIRTH